MKEEANNEMDLLLRRLGRTMDRSAVHPENGDAGSTPEAHLDADELNAYAENALPPTTRSRYSEHLAECTRCRQIVSQLSQAAGLVFEETTSAQPAVAGLREFISSFFSPMVLRYAVPALGVILVATLGFFMLRQQSGRQEAPLNRAADKVALRTEPAPVQPSPSYDTYNQAQERPVQKEGVKAGEQQPDANKKLDAAEADTAKVEREEKRQEPVTTVDQVAAAPPAPAANYEAPKAKEPSGEKKAVADEAPADARRGQAAAAAPQSVSIEQQKELAKVRDNEGGGRAGAFGVASSKAKSEVSRARSQPSVGTAESNASRRADKDEAQPRSVGGHRFERRGSLWVDVTYDSRATTNVVRGSEQYRALIADEPSIKMIADQLDGEIIVMWNNRAYRIR
jgi:Putative zinc-finger